METLDWNQPSQHVYFALGQLSAVANSTERFGNATLAMAVLSLSTEQLDDYSGPDTADSEAEKFQKLLLLALTFLPGCVAAATLCYDLLCCQVAQNCYSKAILHLFRTVKRPFRDFLTLDDLEDKPGPVVVSPLWKHRTLVALSAIQAAWWAAVLSFRLISGSEDGVLSIAGAMSGLVAWSYAALRIIAKPPRTPPYLLLLFYTVSALSLLVDVGIGLLGWFDRDIRWGNIALDLSWTLVDLTVIWIAGTLPLASVLPAPNVASDKDQTPSHKLTMPEDSVNLWTWMTFSFVAPIFGVATKRTVNEEDVWTLSPFFLHKNLFTKYLDYMHRHPTHSLLRFLLASNSLDLILDILLETWGAVIGFVPPFALQRILSALADPTPGARKTAYLAGTRGGATSGRADSSFCALHYKALKRRDISGTVVDSKNDKEEESSEGADLGKIVNLMQGDAYAVAQRFWEFSGVFLSPVRLTIALVFLYNILGWSSFAGVAIILLAYIFNYPLGKYNIRLNRSSLKARDNRMSLVNELFQNIRFLKFYGWETRWANRVRTARETELWWRVRLNVMYTVISFIWIWIPSATALSTFLCYTLIAGQKLTVAKAFTSIALFSQLQGPMTALPNQIFALLSAYVSMQRIEAFLNEQEVPDWATSLKRAGSQEASDRIGFEDATFEWDSAPKEEPSRFTLGPLNISFPRGKLTLVSGATGAGKSALLNALLGEMHCVAGHVDLDKNGHQVAYAAQSPWLEHATIRDNIIFGSSVGFDEQRYQDVVDACALRRDLEIFDAGDMTEIGEKGITLSGGQRARIALARALYSQASLILLDDPLAAVDMHTASHLVKHALSGKFAKDRTIILVTHHISLCLPVAWYLVELCGGRVVRQGTMQELQAAGHLKKLVETEDITTSPIRTTLPPVGPDNEADRIDGEPPAKRQRSDGKLIEAEGRAEGRVSLRSYLTYIRAAGIIASILTVYLLIQIQLINIAAQFYLARWGEAYEQEEASLLSWKWPWESLPPPDQNVVPWLLIYFYISMAGAFSVVAFISLGYYSSIQASRTLFNQMLNRLTGAPTRFFDVTPIGRILNRWTADINTVDQALQSSFRAALSGTLNFLASFIVVVCVVPSFMPFAIFIAWLYVRLAPSYVKASRDLRRLESISLSPAFAGFDELLRGLPHVRAFGMEFRYQDRFYKRVDRFQSFDHVYWLVANWLRWRYDCLGSMVVFLTTLFALWSGIGDGLAALVIVQAETFAEASRQLVKVLAQVELDFNSVERIVEYLDVPQEAPAIIEEKRPPAYWPSSSGELVVRDLEVKYAPDLPSVLHRISFTVRPSEKVGVVGRTGSGKSTLALSLLRIIEPCGGDIIIDGIDISSIGLDDLRTRVTIVSQDVSLFTGTIRSNLDPFGEHTDAECMAVLERCHLTPVLSSSSSSGASTPNINLDMAISQTGSLSAGERQLVALARAVLRRSSVIIMDEATSQIDTDLDDQIQRTIREEFASSIVITIAHRLKTVLDYDRILVLGHGEILEFDTPAVLINKPGGVFREMCRASADWRMLKSIVEHSCTRLYKLPIMSSESGTLVLINGTPYAWHKADQAAQKMASWTFPETIEPGQTHKASVEWVRDEALPEHDDRAFVAYRLDGTDHHFRLHAKIFDHAFTLQVHFDRIATAGNPEGSVHNLGWKPGCNIPFVLSGTAPSFWSSNPPANWMQAQRELIGGRKLRHICMPGSHDAGISKLDPSFNFADHILTQSRDIAYQLSAGARYLDLRPVLASGCFKTGHYGEVQGVMMGGNGQTIAEIIDQINTFTEVHKELVILVFSHDSHTDEGYRGLNQGEYEALLNELCRIKNLYVAPDPTNVDLSNSTLNDFIEGGRAAVVCIVDSSIALGDFHKKGFYRCSQYDVYNRYSDTPELEKMVDDQLKKLHEARPSPDHPPFLLSWTLTETISTIVFGGSSILDFAKSANSAIFDGRLLSNCSKTTYPNILLWSRTVTFRHRLASTHVEYVTIFSSLRGFCSSDPYFEGMGEGGIFTLINGTPYTWRKLAQHAYQMKSWNFPDAIEPGQVYKVAVEWHENIFEHIGDDGADVQYQLEGTPNHFQLQARVINRLFTLQAHFDAIATAGNPEGSTIDLGWRRDQETPFILSGTVGQFWSSNPPADWMQSQLPLIGSRRLRQICMPGSHDAGMSKLNGHSLLGSIPEHVLTQSHDIAYQLSAGSRYFDIRPVISEGQFKTGHYDIMGEPLKGQGANGQLIVEIIDQVNAFTEAHKELVILLLSHDYNTDDGYRGFTQSEYDKLLEDLCGIKDLYVAPDPANVDLSQLPLNDFIGGGRAAVICVVQSTINLGEYQHRGFYRYDQHNVYNSYSDARELDRMISDQLLKLREQRPSPDHPLFLLSWTLTEDAISIVLEGSSILHFAKIADPAIFNGQLMTACSKSTYPNILYIDDFRSEVTALAMYINAWFAS
ncbi:hypothetical protein NM688_g2996 [Phlebia brevispora]|uniref:Uncharacterized protein n=1 Tax=Phlebia brevispora TaxID=194682 RepID=A0ACC1T6W3_9APHY|nr:hypothetical protein NM688_g2996 [Phlebia brevispora]